MENLGKPASEKLLSIIECLLCRGAQNANNTATLSTVDVAGSYAGNK